MIIFPAIDLKEGRCVRLIQGEMAKQTVYGDDPAAMAQRWKDAGARVLHVVDLDGAVNGHFNLAAVEAIVKCGIPVQLGGGIRTLDDITYRLEKLGVWRVIIGTAAIENPTLVKEAAAKYPGRILVGIDAWDGVAATHGWQMDSGMTALELGMRVKDMGISTIVYTDIAHDGMMQGTNIGALKEMIRETGLQVIASGGISSLDDLRAASGAGAIGAITGKALYEGAFTLQDALPIETERKCIPASIIPCLDTKDGRVVKGIQFEGLRDAGDPAEAAARYCEEGADELVVLDISATVEGRQTLLDIVTKTKTAINGRIPLTVGGGIANLQTAQAVLGAGADKIGINSAAVRTPELIDAISCVYGRNSLTVAIDVLAQGDGWNVVINGGTVTTPLDVVAWAREVELRGAGAILLTSKDKDGTKQGFDIPLTKAVVEAVGIPVIASGGAGCIQDFIDAANIGAEGLLAASLFHFREIEIAALRDALTKK